MSDIEKRVERYERENQRAHQRIMDEIITGDDSVKTIVKNIELKVDAAATISSWMKWVTGISISIIIVLLSIIAAFSGYGYKDSKEAAKQQYETFRIMKGYAMQLDSIIYWQKQFKDFRKDANNFYATEFDTVKTRSLENEKMIKTIDNRSKKNMWRIGRIEKRVGIK